MRETVPASPRRRRISARPVRIWSTSPRRPRKFSHSAAFSRKYRHLWTLRILTVTGSAVSRCENWRWLQFSHHEPPSKQQILRSEHVAKSPENSQFRICYGIHWLTVFAGNWRSARKASTPRNTRRRAAATRRRTLMSTSRRIFAMILAPLHF